MNSKTLRRPGLLCLLFAMVLPLPSQAHYLTILGQFAELKVTLKDSSIQLHALYRIDNHGDESARDVFPTFQVGKWKWGGDPTTLDQAGSHTWTVDVEIPSADLAMPDGKQLPMIGVAPLLVRRHYRDLNGYAFSAVDIVSVQLGELTNLQNLETRVPLLEATWKLSGDGQKFSGDIAIRNAAETATRVWLISHAPREMEATGLPPSVEVGAKATAHTNIEIQNEKGLVGSSYATWVVMVWEDFGIRNFIAVNNAVKIVEPTQIPWMIILVGSVTLILGAIAFIVVRRTRNG